jgi:hypothetical protein
MPLKQNFMTALTDTWTTATDGDAAGSIRWEWDLTNGVMNAYKCVLYDEGTATLDVAVGDVVGYVDDTGYAAHTVTADVSDTGNVGAGVCMAAVTVTSTYMWIKIKGPATLNTTLTSAATNGSALTLTGANDKTLEIVGAFTEFVVATTVDDANDEILCDFPY